MGKPGKSYNDLELVEGDIDYDSNEKNDNPLDPRAGNVSIEIPLIQFNPKDVANILNKYVTEVNCTRKCLIEITKLMKWYNRLGDGILPYKPKDLKLNSQVLKRKKKKHLSKMVKEGVKKLEMVDSKIKKSSRVVIDNHKSLKKLDNMGEIIVEHGKIGKSVWKVRKFDENNAMKENCSLNGSWTVTEELKNDDISNKTEYDNDKPPLLVPAGFIVASPEQISTPSLKSLKDNQSSKISSSKKRKSPKSDISIEAISKNNIQKSNYPIGVKDELQNTGCVSKKVRKSEEFTNTEVLSLSSIKTPESTATSTKNKKKLNNSNNTTPIRNTSFISN